MIKPGQLYRVIDGPFGVGEVINVLGKERRKGDWLINTDVRPQNPDFYVTTFFLQSNIDIENFVLIYDPEDSKLQSFEPTSNNRLSEIE